MLLCKYGIPFRIARTLPIQFHSVLPVVKRVPKNFQDYSILNNVANLRIDSRIAQSGYSQSANRSQSASLCSLSSIL